MPNRKEILHELDHQVADADWCDNDWKDNVPIWMLRGALNLLREQETTPVLEGPVYGLAFYYICEKCKNTLLRDDVYCSHCGRKVKWND